MTKLEGTRDKGKSQLDTVALRIKTTCGYRALQLEMAVALLDAVLLLTFLEG